MFIVLQTLARIVWFEFVRIESLAILESYWLEDPKNAICNDSKDETIHKPLRKYVILSNSQKYNSIIYIRNSWYPRHGSLEVYERILTKYKINILFTKIDLFIRYWKK